MKKSGQKSSGRKSLQQKKLSMPYFSPWKSLDKKARVKKVCRPKKLSPPYFLPWKIWPEKFCRLKSLGKNVWVGKVCCKKRLSPAYLSQWGIWLEIICHRKSLSKKVQVRKFCPQKSCHRHISRKKLASKFCFQKVGAKIVRVGKKNKVTAIFLANLSRKISSPKKSGQKSSGRKSLPQKNCHRHISSRKNFGWINIYFTVKDVLLTRPCHYHSELLLLVAQHEFDVLHILVLYCHCTVAIPQNVVLYMHFPRKICW